VDSNANLAGFLLPGEILLWPNTHSGRLVVVVVVVAAMLVAEGAKVRRW